MEFYSFQYPPRPIPSDAHRPSRYYFHNLEQDQIFKRTQFSFHKEGIPPKVHVNVNMNTDMNKRGVEILDRNKFLAN